MQSNRKPLVTTDYVLDELLTLLKARGKWPRVQALVEELRQDELTRVRWVREDDFQRAWEVFLRFHDQAWSFTDCVSRVVMEQMGIKKAFTFDEHFLQFGTVEVVP